MTSDIERITRVETQNLFQDQVIGEVRAEMKEIRTLVHAINSKLSSITHDQALSSRRLEETHKLATDLTVLVDRMVIDETKRNFVAKIGAKALTIAASVGATLITLYQFRYAIWDFLRKVFI